MGFGGVAHLVIFIQHVIDRLGEGLKLCTFVTNVPNKKNTINSQKNAGQPVSKMIVSAIDILGRSPNVKALEAAQIQQYLAPQFKAVGLMKYGEQKEISPRCSVSPVM